MEKKNKSTKHKTQITMVYGKWKKEMKLMVMDEIEHATRSVDSPR